MGLILYLSGFACSLTAAFALVFAGETLWSASDFVHSPTSIPADLAGYVVIVAVMLLSAWVGARSDQGWLSEHRAASFRLGVVAGAVTAAVLLPLGALWTWAAGPVAAVAMLFARVFVFVGSAVITQVVIARGARSGRHPQ